MDGCCPLHGSPPTEGSHPCHVASPPLLSAAVLASALVLSACGEEAATPPSSAALSAVTVEGSDAAKAPTVTVEAPLEVTKTES